MSLSIYEHRVCECGHLEDFHGMRRPQGCNQVGCACRKWRPMPSVLERLSLLEEKYRNLALIFDTRLDLLAGAMRESSEMERDHDLELVRGALNGSARPSTLLAALERLLSQRYPQT